MLTANEIRSLLFLAPAVTLLAALLVGATRRWALAWAVLDHPNARSSHTRPTPRGGGLGIVLATLITWLVLPMLGIPNDRPLGIVIWGATIVALVSFWEDVRQSLGAKFRLAMHLLMATAVVAVLARSLPLAEQAASGPVARIVVAAVAILWIAGLTNAYNFMDGIDGIAGGQAVVAGGGWCLIGALSGSVPLAAMGGTIAAASLGFLVYNWPPARIFLGDVGSTFLGFLLAGLGLASAAVDLRLPVCGLLLVWPFVFDTAFTLLRRARRRENLLTAHRSHLYQRLVVSGWSHGRVSLLYAGLAVCGLLLAVIWEQRTPWAGVLIVSTLAALAAALWALVAWKERTAPTPVALPPTGIKQAPSEQS